jgi:stage II sporulation protein P
MVKRFRSKRHTNVVVKYLLYLFAIYIVLSSIFYFLFSHIEISNRTILNTLLSESNHNIIESANINAVFDNFINLFSNVSINKPTTILASSLVSVVDISDANSGIIEGIAFEDDYSNMTELEKVSGYVKDPNPETEVSNPKVYIYNSHQLENYSMKTLEPYNIMPNVMLASYILRENLNKLGLPTIVDETNLVELMRVNTWTYVDSYKASRIPLIDAKAKYNTLEYYIDVHRDSPSRGDTTLTMNNKNYARVMFVVGLDNPKYNDNLKLARKLHQLVEVKYPKLSRGVLTKKGRGVNGIYNQDISPNMILLEIGGYANTVDEVSNTTEIMAKIIYDYIEGDQK